MKFILTLLLFSFFSFIQAQPSFANSENKIIQTEESQVIFKELAHVLSGGDTSIDKTLSEDDLFELELNAFMRLIETQETQDRIKYTLATGKPLVN